MTLIPYLKSREFIVTAVLAGILLYYVGVSDLANYIQDSTVFAWSYVIHKLRVHHQLLKSITKEGSTDNNTD